MLVIRSTRRRKGIKQKDLARKLGISQSYLSRLEHRIEKADFNVSCALIMQLAKELDICPFGIVNDLYTVCDTCKISNCPRQ